MSIIVPSLTTAQRYISYMHSILKDFNHRLHLTALGLMASTY